MALLCARIPAGPGQPRSSPVPPLSSLGQSRTRSSSRDQRWEVAETLYECLRNGRKDPHLPKSPPPAKAACSRQTAAHRNKARKRQSDQKKEFGTKANVALTQRPCPGSKQLPKKRACKQSETSIPEGFCQCRFPEDLTHSPCSREEPAPHEHWAGEPERVPAPVLWKPRKMKPFLLLRN